MIHPSPSAETPRLRALSLVCRVIRESSREHPADATLRATLKAQAALSRADGAWISRALFAYYRWSGWLSQPATLEQQVNEATQLADRFAHRPETFTDAELMTRAVPAWVASEMELTANWTRALQAQPRIWLRAKRGQGLVLADKLRDSRVFGEPPLAEIVEYCGMNDLFRTPEFQAGEFELQDLSSQIVGLLCNPIPGETWWDACAGEGGKLLQLSDLMQNRGLIWATDRASWRLRSLKRRTARAKVFNYRAALWDGGSRLPVRTKFDGVLVDAPCSGVGTWQRNPQARWTTRAEDISELAQVQAQILTHAAPAVKPGGKLIYAVCTLTRAETEGVTAAFARECPDFEPLVLSNPLEPHAAPQGRLRLLPEVHGGNGMFVAAWKRRAVDSSEKGAKGGPK